MSKWQFLTGDFDLVLPKRKNTLFEHFSEKFPEQSAAISVLARLNAALRSVLTDYEEIRTWLAVQKPAEPRDPKELERARRLAKELETEILNHLEKQDGNNS